MCTLDDTLCDQLTRCSLDSELSGHIELWQRTCFQTVMYIKILTSANTALILGSYWTENVHKVIDILEGQPNRRNIHRENANHPNCRCRMDRTCRRFVVEADIS